MKKLLTFLFLTSNFILFAQEAQQALQKTDHQFFIENKGQWPDEVLFLTRTGGMDAWITKGGVVYDFFRLKEIDSSDKNEKSFPDKFERLGYSRHGHVVKLELENINSKAEPEGKEKSSTYYNYFIGNDSTRWASFVGLYKEAVVKNIYEGVDIRYYFDNGYLRYDYLVNPGADPSKIIFTLNGSDNSYINANGELVFTTRFGETKQTDLFTYQIINGEKKKIESGFALKDGKISFEIENYLACIPLIIDPLVYSTYLGGIGVGSYSEDKGHCIKVDPFGNTIVSGTTRSTSFPTTIGAYDQSFNDTTAIQYSDGFISKFNATGSALIFSTYLGGHGYDEANSIAIDLSGNTHVTGSTVSSNFPTTPGTFSEVNSGISDVFVTKLNSTGSSLIYSTFIGGTNSDVGFAITVDISGNAYVTGRAHTAFPITPSAFDSTYNFNDDAFVLKLNSSGSSLIYSTYLGSNNTDAGYGIAIDNAGNAFVVGERGGVNFPLTPGAFDSTSIWGGFITKLNPAGTTLIYSTFLSGKVYDIAIDSIGNAYVTGETTNLAFPTTPGAFDTTLGGNYPHGFVTKINPTGSALIFSTLLGGNYGASGNSIKVDSFGNIYITGGTNSNNFPTTPGAFDPTYNGTSWDDVFITKMNSTGTDLIYSSYLGGSNTDIANSIDIDNNGNAYITGFTSTNTNTNNFPTTPGAYDQTFGGSLVGGTDAFVAKFSIPLCVSPTAVITASGSTLICQGSSVTLNANTGTGLSYQWQLNGNNINGATNSTHDAISTGNYSVIVSDSCGSSISNIIPVTVTSAPGSVGSITGPNTICKQTTHTFSVNPVAGATNYVWSVPPMAQIISGAGTNSIVVKFKTKQGNITVKAANQCGAGPLSVLPVTVVKCFISNNEVMRTTFTESEISIYPNPSQTSFNCIISGAEDQMFSLSVFDYAGRIVELHEDLVSNNNFTFGNDLSPGFYFVEINTGEKKEIFKIVKVE